MTFQIDVERRQSEQLYAELDVPTTPKAQRFMRGYSASHTKRLEVCLAKIGPPAA